MFLEDKGAVLKSYKNLFRIKNVVLCILFALLSVGYVYAFSIMGQFSRKNLRFL